MVEMDDPEPEEAPSAVPVNSTGSSISSSDDTVVEPVVYNTYNHGVDQVHQTNHQMDTSPPPSPIYNPPRHPTSIFSFPTPTAYCAPPNATASLTPVAHGSASELYKCIVKKPDVVQLEINGEMQSNASDVTVQFLAELRVYTTLSRHRNI